MKPMNEEHFAILRRHMIDVIRIHTDRMSDELGTGALEERVLSAMLQVPRHFFVPGSIAHLAYHDVPLPIGFDKTISQPFISALMADLLAPERHEKVLEIGTGLGYQAAVLSQLAHQVWSVEIVEEFASRAESNLSRLGYSNVSIRVGDGTRGWPEYAPYDKILVTAGAEEIPPALLEQLRAGGRLVLPLGPPELQRLTVADKDAGGHIHVRELIPVRFSRLETIM